MNRFLSFADSRMSAALERLGRQAEALDFFDEITLFTEHDLSAEFTSRMGRYLTPSCRGFGYWSWKPWSIHHVLQEMEEGDRLLYLDAGCHINANGTERFREYVNLHWIGGRTVDFSQLRHIRRPLVYTLHDMFACTAGCHCTMDCSLFQDECRGNCPQLGAPRLFRNIPAWLFSRKRRAFGRIPSLTLVTPSLWLKREVERSCMFPGRKIVQIYNPVDTDLFRPAEDRNAIRAGLGIPPGAFVIACGATGLFNPVKGGHFIPLVLEELYRRGHRNLHLLLFGNQEKSVDYPFPSTSAGFITDMNKLAGLYSAADIFLNPTLQDVLSNVALESMACKTPSVTFRTGGVPEAVLDGRTGLVAPQGDLNQMAAHCERLIQDGKLLQTLAEEGRRHAEQTFSYPVIAARHAALYEETLREYRYEE